MDYWYFTITIYSELDGVDYTERGILIADDQVEAAQKLERFYEGDRIKQLDLQWMTDEGVCILPAEGQPIIPNIFESYDPIYEVGSEICTSPYTIKAENIS